MANDDKSNWEYKSEDSSAGPADDDSDQPAKATGKPAKAFSWSASEYIDHQQGAGWYSLLALATVGVSAIIYLVTRDYFGVGITLVAGLILAIFARKTPRQLLYELSDDGFKIEQKLYPYSLFKSYSIIQDGPLMSLNFSPVKRFMPVVSAYFAAPDQAKISQALENKLPYEPKELDSIDRLSRRLRF